MRSWINIAFSNIGKRDENQDFLCSKSIKAKRRRYVLLLVCDGLGGHPNGKECSYAVGKEIVCIVTAYLWKRKSCRPMDNNDAVKLSQLLAHLRELKASNASRTTMALMLISQKKQKGNFTCISIWGGDSKIYYIDQSGFCQQVSHDHYDEQDNISVFFSGTGKLHGHLSYEVLKSRTPLLYAVASDGIRSRLKGLFKFFYGCVSHEIKNNAAFEAETTNYLGDLVSDNYTAAMLYLHCPEDVILKSFRRMQIK